MKMTHAVAAVAAPALMMAGMLSPIVAMAEQTKSTDVTLKASDANLVVTVPTVMPFVMNGDGTLTTASDSALQIVNGSAFGIQVTDVTVTENAPFNIVEDAKSSNEANAIDFRFGIAGAMMDAHNPTFVGGMLDMEAAGGDDTLSLTASGHANNINEDVTEGKSVASISWSFAPGSGMGDNDVDVPSEWE